MNTTQNTCDVIVPVFNGLSYVVEALESIVEHTAPTSYTLYLVDDCSDAETALYLSSFAASHDRTVLLRNSKNLGYVLSCVRAYEEGGAPFALLLNSDVVVTAGWLDRLLACAHSDTRIASVNPLTNRASQISVPMYPGANFHGMNQLFRRRSPRYPDVVTGVGFCMLLKREAVASTGFFDPVFGHGYCEDSDLCMRLTTGGYRAVVADDVYVYHRGSASFRESRAALYRSNRRIFDERWAREYARQFAAYRATDPLKALREVLPVRKRWDPTALAWETGRAVLDAIRAVRPRAALLAALRGLSGVRKAFNLLPTPGALEMATRPGRLRVTYILHRLVVAGGVLSAIQVVNGLIRLGVEARIVTLFEDPIIHQWTRLYTRPIVYRNERELVEQFPPSDVVVATLWTTAEWARAVLDSGRANVGVYFMQDYEPWFFPENARTDRRRVQNTFGMLDHRIVKSDWLGGMLLQDGYSSMKIPLGLDLSCFYPRTMKPPSGPRRVLAMARPGTPQRGFATLVQALEHLKSRMPDLEIILFGDRNLRKQRLPFPFRTEGIVVDLDYLAQLYSNATIFIDASDFQGFGRCGLEAMACGAGCILTNEGGVREYAEHGKNAILVPPKRPDLIAEAAIDLLSDSERLAELVAAGRCAAQRFCHRREAERTMRYFLSLTGEVRAT